MCTELVAMPKAKIDVGDREVGSRVRMRRLMLGISIQALGNAVGVCYQQMQKYEKGVNRISASRLQRIAQILQIGPSFFFEDAPDKSKEATGIVDYLTDFLATRDGVELVMAFSRIKNRKVRRAIVELIEQIVPD
jgi:transcriptional regulator with XRE-family HTH domain